MHIVHMWPKGTFRYLREIEIVTNAESPQFLNQLRWRIAGPQTATVAYEVGDDGHTIRAWFVLQPQYDGIDPPLLDLEKLPDDRRNALTIQLLPVHRLVEPDLEPGRPTKDWVPLIHPAMIPPPLGEMPTRIELRWKQWIGTHKPRIQRPPGRFRRFLRWLGKRWESRFDASRTIFRRRRRRK